MSQLSPRHVALGLAIISAAALSAAFISQYVFGLQPCVLCIYQRIPYAIIVFLGLWSWFMGPARFARHILIMCLMLLMTEFMIAAFHVGVEQKWWEGTDACQLKLEGATAEQIRERILNAPKALCTDIAWSLFGISMAGYNAMMSLGLFIATALYLRHSGESRNPA